MKPGHWAIDDKIDLTETWLNQKMHLQSTIDDLMQQGLTWDDAVAFAWFIFCEAALDPECRAEDGLTEEQYDRLTLVTLTAAPKEQHNSAQHS